MRELNLRPPGSSPDGGGRFWLLALVVALVALAGYAGYVAYPRFGLPSAAGAGLLLLAAGAGVASFFSPCSFPLLLTLLGRQAEQAKGRADRMGTILKFAAAFSAGAVVFTILLGLLVGLGGRAFVGSITFTSPQGIALRIVVGILLVFLGLIQLEVLPLSFHRVEGLTRPVGEATARLRRRHPMRGFALFGFGYLLAGFG